MPHAVRQQVKLFLPIILHRQQARLLRFYSLSCAKELRQLPCQFAAVKQPMQIRSEYVSADASLRRTIRKDAERLSVRLCLPVMNLIARKRRARKRLSLYDGIYLHTPFLTVKHGLRLQKSHAGKRHAASALHAVRIA